MRGHLILEPFSLHRSAKYENGVFIVIFNRIFFLLLFGV